MANLLRALLVTLLLAAGACVPSGPRSDPAPRPRPEGPEGPADRAIPELPPDAARWRFAYGPGVERYSITTAAEIEAAEEAGERQSAGSLLLVTYELPADPATEPVLARVDSFEVRGGNGAPATHPLPYPLRFAFRVAGMPDDGAAALDPVDCERPDATVRAIARALLPAMPAIAAPGTAWRDSTTVASCRGGIPILVTTVTDYRVERPGSEGSLLPVVRTSRITIASAGGETGGRWITGSGTAEGRLFFDLPSGRLESGLVQSRTTLTLDAPGQYRTFRQQAVQEIRRLVPP